MTNDDVILINFDNNNNNNSSNTTTTINYDESEDSGTTYNRIYFSKNKGGLSAGAIVAIALALLCNSRLYCCHDLP